MADERQFHAGSGPHGDQWRAQGGPGPDGQGQAGGYARFAPPSDEDQAGPGEGDGARPGNPARPLADGRHRAPGVGSASAEGDAPWMPSGVRQPMPSARPSTTGSLPQGGGERPGGERRDVGRPATHPAAGDSGLGERTDPGVTQPSRYPSAASGAGATPGTAGYGVGAAGPAPHDGSTGPRDASPAARDGVGGRPPGPDAHGPGYGFGAAAPAFGGGGPGGSGTGVGGPGSGTGGTGGGVGRPGGGYAGSGPSGKEPRDGSRKRSGVAVPVVVLLSVVALLLGLVLGAVGGRWVFPEGDDSADGEQETGSAAGESASGAVGVDRPDASVAQISDRALASTVYIEAQSGNVGGSGTGMIYSEDGLVVTNNHVIEPAVDGGRVTVTFHDGTQEEAELVGRSPGYDLAVLQVPRDGLVPLVLADSEEVVIGDLVIAVGAPLGLTGTVTAGIVSAMNRPVAAGEGDDVSYINAIQTDAAINPGNSGGPLLNYDGEVVGINSVIYAAPSESGVAGSIGLGFAIPANQVETTVQQLIEDGTASFAQIGISLDPSYFGEGVRVAETDDAIVPDGPGDEAGIEPGDIITAVDGTPVTDPSEVIVFVRSRQGGDTLTLTIERDGDEEEVEVPLTEVEEEL